MLFPNGSEYIGQFSHGKFHGRGVLSYYKKSGALDAANVSNSRGSNGKAASSSTTLNTVANETQNSGKVAPITIDICLSLRDSFIAAVAFFLLACFSLGNTSLLFFFLAISIGADRVHRAVSERPQARHRSRYLSRWKKVARWIAGLLIFSSFCTFDENVNAPTRFTKGSRARMSTV